MKPLVILFSAFLLFGCAASNPYEPPKGDESSLATIRGHSNRTGLAEWENYWIDRINEKAVSYTFRDFDTYDIPVTPQESTYVIYTEFNRGWSDPCPCQAFLLLVAELQPGKSYALNGRVQGIEVQVWIEDVETGERVSEVAKSPYRSSPRDVYVPLIF